MSAPEVALWSQLRGSKLGFKVRRQHPIGPYVADFFVRERRLVIETRIWRSAKPRRCQDTYMEERGYRILRIAAHDVVQDLDAVTLHIAEQVMNPLHLPSDGPPPHSGEDH